MNFTCVSWVKPIQRIIKRDKKTLSILLNFISIKGKKSITQSSLYKISSESAIMLSLYYLWCDVMRWTYNLMYVILCELHWNSNVIGLTNSKEKERNDS